MCCKYCHKELPDGVMWCCWCGRKQQKNEKKKRGNGEGSIIQVESRAGKKYKAIVTGEIYTVIKDGKLVWRRHTKSRVCNTKKEAVACIPELQKQYEREKEAKAGQSRAQKYTLQDIYNMWLPVYSSKGVGKSTMGCYTAAWGHIADDYKSMIMDDISIEDYQEMLDDCDRGKRTKQNLKTLIGLLFKFAIPRRYVQDQINMADYLILREEDGAARDGFSSDELVRIKAAADNGVEDADIVLMMCFLGFRPTAFLSLRCEDYRYDDTLQCGSIVGGIKTAAGKGRTVTVSGKVEPFVKQRIGGRKTGYLIERGDGTSWTLRAFTNSVFYPALVRIGIDNPIIKVNGVERHKYTPHSCRHTFADLLKKAKGPDADKLKLIGHTSTDMLRHYQQVELEELKNITDQF